MTFLGMILAVDLQIRSYTGGMVQTNAYLLGRGESCILIDAPLGVTEWLEEIGEHPCALLLTHQHYDHIEDAAKLSAKGVRIFAHSPYSRDLTLETLKEAMGMMMDVAPYEVDELLEGKDHLEIGDKALTINHVPGHSPDSISFHLGNAAFVGDTLFARGIGRPDLPGGNMETLLRCIRDKILTLDADTIVYPGHGPDTTVGIELAENPYLNKPYL